MSKIGKFVIDELERRQSDNVEDLMEEQDNG